MMKYVSIGIVAVLVIGGGVFYFSEHRGTPEGAFSGSFSGLVERGGNWKCTFKSEDEGGKASGTIYIGGESVRGDFVTTGVGTQPVESHMIQDGGYIYLWTPLAPQGFKSQVTLGSDAGNEGAFSATDQYDYACSPWSRDQAVFTPPASVTFIES